MMTLLTRTSCTLHLRRQLFSVLVFLFLSLLGAAVAADETQDASAGAGDTPLENFVRNAMTLNMTEIEAGNLAQKKSQSGHVQTFAQQMARHHTAINQRLVGLANDKDIQISEAKNLVKNVQPALKALKASSSFDRDYAENQIKSHEKTILFLNQAEALEDDDIKIWARETLKKIYDHLENAKALRDQVSPERIQAEQQERDQQQ